MLKMLKYLLKYKLRVLLVAAFIFASSFADLSMPSYMSNILNAGTSGSADMILSYALIMTVIAVASISLNAASVFFSSYVSAAFGRDLRSRVFRKAQSLSLREFDSIGTSSMMTRTTNDITQVQMFAEMAIRIALKAPFMFTGSVIMAFNFSLSISGVLMVSVPLLIVGVAVVSRIVMPYADRLQKNVDGVNLIMREKLTGIRVIKAFSAEKHEEERFDKANSELTRTTIRMNVISSLIMPLMMLVLNTTTIAVVWVSGRQVLAGNMMAGDIIAIIQYIMHIMMSMMMFSMILVMYPRAASSAARINEALGLEPSVADGPLTGSPAGSGIEFRDVSFYYPGAELPVLSNISFTAQQGKTTAIIGGTGSGKSTLVRLIPRFYDASSGQVLVGGVDVREYAQDDLRSKIGYVPQKAALFKGTAADNIRFGKRDAGEDEIKAALKTAQADFVLESEQGLDYSISQLASNLSGGQKQRLSIARAVVRRPDIFIFDDSFSALDFKTDSKLRAALKNDAGGATVIIVAQRVSTIMDADRIIVMNNGRVAGSGTHGELMKSCEIYREIVDSQLSEEEAV